MTVFFNDMSNLLRFARYDLGYLLLGQLRFQPQAQLHCEIFVLRIA